MYVRYGNYQHELGEVALDIRREALRTDGGLHYAEKINWSLSGILQAESFSALKTDIQSIEQAYSVPNLDLRLIWTDGTTDSAHVLRASECLDGPRAVRGPNFPESFGPEAVTQRRFTIEIEAEKALSNPETLLLSWKERVITNGGGPRYRWVELVTGPPQKQRLVEQTTYKATQSGEAVGYRGEPVPPQPIWPAALIEAPEFTFESPVKRGRGKQTGYYVGWRYEFESGTPLFGRPHAQF